MLAARQKKEAAIKEASAPVEEKEEEAPEAPDVLGEQEDADVIF